MSKYKVLVTARSFGKSDSKAVEILESNGCEVKKLEAANGSIVEQLKAEIPTADAVVAGLEMFDAELIGSAKNLKVISRYGVGYDKVDLEAATKNGVKVTITPGANSESVADMAMSLMLSLARNICVMDRTMKAEDQQRPQGVEMFGKTLGIVGAGRIGRGVARRCLGFNMRILYYDIFENKHFNEECGAKFVSIDTIVKEADFITIHSPLTPETKNMFAKEQFEAMKNDAIVVNTARGGIINERDLYEALLSGQIRGAGLDATVKEPPYGEDILKLDNCIVTPHAGASTKEASSKMSFMAAQNIVDILSGKNSDFIVNK